MAPDGRQAVMDGATMGFLVFAALLMGFVTGWTLHAFLRWCSR